MIQPETHPQPLRSGLIPQRGDRVMVRGEGCRLFDLEGRAFLDLTSGHGVAALGHSHPALSRAIAEQADRLVVCSAAFANDQRDRFLEILRGIVPERFVHAFLCNSGAEANEAALKFAHLHHGRPGLVALKRSFHGRTLGALATTWNPHYRTPFADILRPVEFVQDGDHSALDQALGDQVGAMIVEVVQGEGGVQPIDPAYLQAAQELCQQRGIVFIVDEIQTGIGRTGKWFAHQHAGLQPDIMTLAKGIGGGFPIGVVVSTEEIAGKLAPGLHGSTFGGNPLASAAAAATLETLLADGIVERVDEIAEHLRAGLERALAGNPLVREIRTCGLMIGIELRQKVAPYLTQLMEEHGVIALAAGPTVLRLLPPLILSVDEADEGIAAVAAVLGSAPLNQESS